MTHRHRAGVARRADTAPSTLPRRDQQRIRAAIDLLAGEPWPPGCTKLAGDLPWSGEPIYVTRRGRPVAILLDPEIYQRLLDDAEGAVDRAELRAARGDDDYVPWDDVKADLGLT